MIAIETLNTQAMNESRHGIVRKINEKYYHCIDHDIIANNVDILVIARIISRPDDVDERKIQVNILDLKRIIGEKKKIAAKDLESGLVSQNGI